MYQSVGEMKWRHCTVDPPKPGATYFIIQLLDNGMWFQTWDYYGWQVWPNTAAWSSGIDRTCSWWIEVPLPYPDPETVMSIDEVNAEA